MSQQLYINTCAALCRSVKYLLVCKVKTLLGISVLGQQLWPLIAARVCLACDICYKTYTPTVCFVVVHKFCSVHNSEQWPLANV